MTLDDAVEIYLEDARAHGIDIDRLIEQYNITIRFKSLADGVAGQTFGTTIYINKAYWKGSDVNLNTVYHEFGHVFGLKHGETPIMAFGGFASTIMQDQDEYWELVKRKIGQQ